jgi:hypothetical protein
VSSYLNVAYESWPQMFLLTISVGEKHLPLSACLLDVEDGDGVDSHQRQDLYSLPSVHDTPTQIG